MNSKADAQSNFRILAELNPTIGPTPEMLFDKEVDRLRTGALVIPTLDELNRASAKLQISEMAAGRLENEGVEFLRLREARIDRDHPLYTGHQLRQGREAAATGAQRPNNFEDVLARFDGQIPTVISQVLGSRITRYDAPLPIVGIVLISFPAGLLAASVTSFIFDFPVTIEGVPFPPPWWIYGLLALVLGYLQWFVLLPKVVDKLRARHQSQRAG